MLLNVQSKLPQGAALNDSHLKTYVSSSPDAIFKRYLIEQNGVMFTF